MKRFHYALITAAFAALLLSACGSADTDTAGSSGDNFLVVLNYGKYLDASALKMFEQETGIKIKLEEYESPEEMYTKFSAGSISYDVVRTSDYMVERLIHEGKMAPIDFSSFSYYKNLNPAILAAAEVFGHGTPLVDGGDDLDLAGRRGAAGIGLAAGGVAGTAGGQAEHQGQGKDQGYQFFHVSYSFDLTLS